VPADRLGARSAGSGATRGRKRSEDGAVALRAEALAQSLPPLLVAAERVAATVAQGVHGRRRVGQGETFWQFRRYGTGDPITRIDWRQSAKSDRLYVRQTEWEAAQSVWLWRDATPSMHYRSSPQRPLKLEIAEILLLAVASLLARGGEHLTMLGSGLPPVPGRTAVRRITELAERSRRDPVGLPAVEPLPRYGRLVLLGDFLAALDDIKTMVTAFAGRGVRGHLVQIVDPAEETLPFQGRVLFSGIEDDGEALFGRTETIRDGYRSAFAGHRLGLRAIARAAGWTVLTHHTDQPLEPPLLALYLALAQGGSGC
jgi:uncharacterized protein (DUF58 family)